ncbi:MAG: hypothetical protein ABI790_06495 [Betaproteobacteria bacterium]
MSLRSYIKQAGGILFPHKPADPALAANTLAQMQRNVLARNGAAGKTIESYINSQRCRVVGLAVKYDGLTKNIIVSGIAFDRATREKTIQCCQRIIGVAGIENLLTLAAGESLESRYRAAKPGWKAARPA